MYLIVALIVLTALKSALSFLRSCDQIIELVFVSR